MVYSDFNVVRTIDERKGLSDKDSDIKEIRDFIIFIEQAGLLDVPIMRGNLPMILAQSRTDRFSMSREWIDKLPRCK